MEQSRLQSGAGGSCSWERQSPWNLVEGLGGTRKNPSPGLDASWEQRWVAGVGRSDSLFCGLRMVHTSGS